MCTQAGLNQHKPIRSPCLGRKRASFEGVKMAGLQAAKPIVVICTRDRVRARAFYRDTLGLPLTSEDELATTFDVGGTAMRVSTIADFTPHEHTILGFKVSDVEAAVIGLRERGV